MVMATLAPLATDASNTGYVLNRKNASIALTVGATEVKVGDKVHLSGTLSGVTNKAYAKISLSVIMPDGSTSYPAQGSTTYTSRSGSFSIDLIPKVAGRYTITASYQGDRVEVSTNKAITALAARSTEVPIKAATSIGLTLGSSSVALGETVIASGTLSSGAGVVGAPISASIALPDGTSVNMGRSQISTGLMGSFSVEYAPTMVGNHKLTATYAGNDTLKASTTSVSFAVTSPVIPEPLIKTSLALTPSAATIEAGKSMRASGLLMGSAAVSGATVDVRVMLPDGSTVNPAQGPTVITGQDGTFIMDYTPMTTGNYRLTATFSGNSQFDASSVSATFSATEPTAPPTPDPGTGGGSPTTPLSYAFTVTSAGSNYVTKSASGATAYSGTNAATAIQTALNNLPSGRTSKQAVLLQGDFSVTKAISIPSYTILVLEGKVTWGSTAVGYILTAVNKNNFEVRGGEWDGNKASRTMTSSSNPFAFERCSDVLISNLKVHDGPYDNIEFEYSERITISNVESYNTRWTSIVMAYSNNCIIENCHIHDSDQGGCYFYCEDDGVAQTINNNIIRNNLVERTWTSGLSFSIRGVEDRTDGGLIEGNTVIDGGRDTDHPGINIGWGAGRLATNTVVRNNLIYSTTRAGEGGIEFAGSGCVCEGNTIRDTPGYAIHLVGNNNRVVGNSITNAGWDDGGAGVHIEGSSNVVTDNTITNCRTYGIAVYSGTGNTISPNTFSGNNKNVR